MRALVVQPGPAFSVADVAAGWVKGLRQVGVETVDFRFDERLNFYGAALIERDGQPVKAFNPQEAAMLASKGIEAAVLEVWPDVVVIISGFFVPPAIYELLRVRGFKVVLVHTESPYEDDRQVMRARFADLNVVNDPTNLARFQAEAPAVYLPHCYDPAIHRPRMPTAEAKSDFCFVGTGYPSRIEFLEAVDWTGIDVALGGNWQSLDPDSPLRRYVVHDLEECIDNDDAATLYSSTKVSANLYRKEASDTADGWAMGPREVELAACGTFFLREPRGESDDVLWMLPTFDGPDEFGDLVRWWSSHDVQRAEVAGQAREAVADRTFDKNAAQLLRLLSS